MKAVGFCVLVTVPSEEVAADIARDLVSGNLAACVQIEGPILSVYAWNDKIEEDKEWRLVIKTTGERYTELERVIQKSHPYDVPQIVALPIIEGYHPYIEWLVKATAGK